MDTLPAALPVQADTAAETPTTGAEDLGGYDAVAVITQNVVNSQLAGLYAEGILDTRIDEDWEGASVAAELQAPLVELVVREEGATQEIVLFIVFGAGTFTRSPGHAPVRTDGVRLGFRSSVGASRADRASLAAGARATARLRAAVAALPPGFDVESLYLSLAESVRPERLCAVAGIADPEAARVLAVLCARHFSGGGAAEARLPLGYVPVAGAGHDTATPSLVPTHVEHGLTRNPRDPGLSTFNFLMMCGGRPPPRPRPYLSQPRVHVRDLQGRYLASELRFFREIFFRVLAEEMNAAAPPTWDAARGVFAIRGSIPLDGVEKTVDGRAVKIVLEALAECVIEPPQPGAELRFDLDWRVVHRATCTVDGVPMELSPVEIVTTMTGTWMLALERRTALRVTFDDQRQWIEYEENRAHQRLVAEPPDAVRRLLRDAVRAFGGGTLPVFRFGSFTAGGSYAMEGGAIILPLGKDFFFANLTIAGERNRNLQADLTYID